MGKPAIQLNNFIDKLAIWLQNNQPEFVESYDVSCTHIPDPDHTKDMGRIRFTLNFHVSNKEIKRLEADGLVEGIEL